MKKPEIADDRIEDVKAAYEVYQKALGGKAGYDDFLLIFVMREVEFVEYVRIIEKGRNITKRALDRCGESLRVSLMIASNWRENTPEDLAALLAIRAELKESMDQCKQSLDHPEDSVKFTQ